MSTVKIVAKNVVKCKMCNNTPKNCWCMGHRRDKYIKKISKMPIVGKIITTNRICPWCRSNICLCNGIKS